jgi:hypothetical protein
MKELKKKKPILFIDVVKLFVVVVVVVCCCFVNGCLPTLLNNIFLIHRVLNKACTVKSIDILIYTEYDKHIHSKTALKVRFGFFPI